MTDQSWTAKHINTDRFSSKESVNWHHGAYWDGYKARSVHEAAITEAPSAETIGAWAHKSWRAGWADADMDIIKGTP